jgi:hypothetical protein
VSLVPGIRFAILSIGIQSIYFASLCILALPGFMAAPQGALCGMKPAAD